MKAEGNTMQIIELSTARPNAYKERIRPTSATGSGFRIRNCIPADLSNPTEEL